MMDSENGNPTAPKRPAEECEKIRNYWRKYVYRVMGNSCTGTGVLFEQNYLLTAAHLGFERNRTYQVYVNVSENGERHFQTLCVYIKKRADLAVLYCDALDKLGSLSPGVCEPGREYYMLGFPKDCIQMSPSIDKCLIKSWHPDGWQLYGTPGASPAGYSGGPVVSGSDFCGIVLGTSSKQCVVRILPVSVIKFAFGQAEAIGFSDSDQESLSLYEESQK